MFLKNLSKFTGKHLCQSLFLIKNTSGQLFLFIATLNLKPINTKLVYSIFQPYSNPIFLEEILLSHEVSLVLKNSHREQFFSSLFFFFFFFFFFENFLAIYYDPINTLQVYNKIKLTKIERLKKK